MPRITIGVGGGTGSGKTTVANRILERVLAPSTSPTSPHDAYYRNMEHLSYEERARINFDHPDSLETLTAGGTPQVPERGGAVEIPIYDFTTHARTAETLHVEPAPIILVEGILIFVEPGAAGAARRQAVCRHRRRPALHPPAGTRHQRTWADAGVGHRAVPEDRAPDAPRIRGAQQALRRRHHPRGRVQRGGDRDGSRPHPRVVERDHPSGGSSPPTVAPPLGLRWSTLTIPQPKQRRLRSVEPCSDRWNLGSDCPYWTVGPWLHREHPTLLAFSPRCLWWLRPGDVLRAAAQAATQTRLRGSAFAHSKAAEPRRGKYPVVVDSTAAASGFLLNLIAVPLLLLMGYEGDIVLISVVLSLSLVVEGLGGIGGTLLDMELQFRPASLVRSVTFPVVYPCALAGYARWRCMESSHPEPMQNLAVLTGAPSGPAASPAHLEYRPEWRS